jgi:hypothetical protein
LIVTAIAVDLLRRNCTGLSEVAQPQGDKETPDRVRKFTSKRQSGKDVKRIVAERTSVLRG